jgi:hypothetical protein
MLKSMVLDDVKGFYGYIGFRGDNVWLPESGELEYERSVLALAPKKPFQASLLWLQNMEAITAEQSGTTRRHLRPPARPHPRTREVPDRPEPRT